jgi:hypothetical protein
MSIDLAPYWDRLINHDLLAEVTALFAQRLRELQVPARAEAGVFGLDSPQPPAELRATPPTGA